MLLVVGERLNVPRYRENLAMVAYHRRSWEEHGWRIARRFPAMVYGQTRNRLDKIIPGEKWVVNLCPPHGLPGYWKSDCKKLARRVAEELVADISKNRFVERGEDRTVHEIEAIVLLGRNVARAFGLDDDHGFGTHFEAGGLWYILLPHPSGRNRFWGDPNSPQEVAKWMEHMKGMMDSKTFRSEQQGTFPPRPSS